MNLKYYGGNNYWFAKASNYPELNLGRVLSQHKNRYKIATDDGEYQAEISGKLHFKVTDPSKYPAVGDFVMVDCKTELAIIHHILPRKSVFERKSAGKEHYSQVIAANIDTVFICMSLNNDYNLSRLERYLSVAWTSGAVPVIVLTKSDLCTDLESILVEISSIAPGTDIVITSSYDSESYVKLLSYLKEGMTASFIGSSGVGKSTLINKLAGEEVLRTGDIRQDDKGRHTTTHRELIVLPQGGIVIDNPGMREFGAESVNLSKTFSDIDDLASKCRFRDCTHTTEPGCAVLKAIQLGELNSRRLESYQKLKKEARYNGLSFKELEKEKLNSMFEGIGGMKKARKYIRQNNKRKK